MTEDKVIAKLDFLAGCTAVYASSIGSSSIRRLMSRQIQPIIVDHGQLIETLLSELSVAIRNGELS
jgi:nitrogen fixation protein NifX